MTSQERVLKTLNHKEPDRVPIDIGGMRSTGIAALAYKNLRNHLGLEDQPIKLFDIWQQLALVDDDILAYFHADAKPINRLVPAWFAPWIKLNRWKDGELTDGTKAVVPEGFEPVREEGFYIIKNEQGHIVAKRSETGLYYDHVAVYHPLSEAKDRDEVETEYRKLFPKGQRISQEEEDYLRAEGVKVQKLQYAVLAEFGGSIYEMGQFLRGYKQWYLDIAQDKARGIASCLLDLLVTDYLEALETFVPAIRGYADVIVFTDDLGMQTGPQISPGTYKRLFKPAHREMWKFVKQESELKIFLHCCGSISDLLPDIIEAGADIINPVHINAENMQPERLKKDFGRDIVFWGGGCDTQKILPSGSLRAIEEEVKKNIDVFAPGGGFVFAAVHNIQPDISPEKIVKLYESAYRYGQEVYAR